MLDIFKWECTINEICIGHFLCKYCISFGNIAFPLEILHFLWKYCISFGNIAFPLEILHFLWKYCISFGNVIKKHKIASPEKSTSSDEKEWNCLSFYARKKNKDSFGIQKRFSTKRIIYFFHFIFFFIFY